ncbi:MAG: TIGR03905 family TSCPD domain-containing protein [Clostridia bacterium]|nr:TIGR03905 family TSCPD domain-containing protein [Clostridia bacterium]
MNTYKTKGTCSTLIQFDVDKDGILTEVKYTGGCRGNLQAVSRLVEGKHIDEVIFLLKGIECRGNTSCADQLATALEQYKEKNNL